MRPRTFALVPITFLSAGCMTSPTLPPPDFPIWAEPVPEPEASVVPPTSDVVSRWQLPSDSPWLPYEKLTLLSALESAPPVSPLPNIANLTEVHRAEHAALCLSRTRLPDDTLWLVDLRGAASVAFGTTLSQALPGAIAVVPTFNNLPAENEVVPAEETLSAMLRFDPGHFPADGARTTPVVLLDTWRLAYRSETPDDDAYDNRYMLTPGDLPAADVLRANGIRRVVYVIDHLQGGDVEEDDLHETFIAYAEEGIAIDFVDLEWLCALEVPESWDGALAPRAFVVQSRVTIVNDPRFYHRARGGFGGVHGLPGFHLGMAGRAWAGGG